MRGPQQKKWDSKFILWGGWFEIFFCIVTISIWILLWKGMGSNLRKNLQRRITRNLRRTNNLELRASFLAMSSKLTLPRREQNPIMRRQPFRKYWEESCGRISTGAILQST